MTLKLRVFCPENPVAALERPETVTDLFALYIDKTARQQSKRTLEERVRILDKYDADAGLRLIVDLIPADLRLWVDDHPEWVSDWTIHRVIDTIKRPFSWAWRLGLIDRHPFIGVTHPTGQRGKPTEDADFQKLLQHSPPIFHNVLTFSWLTGARPCELSALQWSFIDVVAGTATLYVHKTARTRKDREPRIIYLSKQIVELLIEIKRHQPEGQKHVFLNSRKRPWNRGSLALRIFRLRKKLGIPKTARFYGMRHAWATKLASNGVDLKMLATLLGHATSRMSEHYIHLAGKTQLLRDELEKGLRGDK